MRHLQLLILLSVVASCRSSVPALGSDERGVLHVHGLTRRIEDLVAVAAAADGAEARRPSRRVFVENYCRTTLAQFVDDDANGMSPVPVDGAWGEWDGDVLVDVDSGLDELVSPVQGHRFRVVFFRSIDSMLESGIDAETVSFDVEVTDPWTREGMRIVHRGGAYWGRANP